MDPVTAPIDREDASPSAGEPTERGRALRAIALGIGLGVVLALLGRRRP